MARYKNYWRWIPVRMLQSYNSYKNSKYKSSQEEIFCRAIEKSLEDTERLPDGSLRVKAIYMVYINRSHKVSGAAYRLNASERSISRWLSDYVDLVAYYAGYKRSNVGVKHTSSCRKLTVEETGGSCGEETDNHR